MEFVAIIGAQVDVDRGEGGSAAEWCPGRSCNRESDGGTHLPIRRVKIREHHAILAEMLR